MLCIYSIVTGIYINNVTHSPYLLIVFCCFLEITLALCSIPSPLFGYNSVSQALHFTGFPPCLRLENRRLDFLWIGEIKALAMIESFALFC